ncbi:hypothetical protein MT418_006853 [Batrachochytrium dendrobatidis]
MSNFHTSKEHNTSMHHRRAISSNIIIRQKIHNRSVSAANATQVSFHKYSEEMEGYADHFLRKLKRIVETGRSQCSSPRNSLYNYSQDTSLSSASHGCFSHVKEDTKFRSSNIKPMSQNDVFVKKHPLSDVTPTFKGSLESRNSKNMSPLEFEKPKDTTDDYVQNSESTIAVSNEGFQASFVLKSPNPMTSLAGAPSISMPAITLDKHSKNANYMAEAKSTSHDTTKPNSLALKKPKVDSTDNFTSVGTLNAAQKCNPPSFSKTIIKSQSAGYVTSNMSPHALSTLPVNATENIAVALTSNPKLKIDIPQSNEAIVSRLDSLASIHSQGGQLVRNQRLVTSESANTMQRLLDPITNIDGLIPIATQPDANVLVRSSVVSKDSKNFFCRSSDISSPMGASSSSGPSSSHLFRSISDHRGKDELLMKSAVSSLSQKSPLASSVLSISPQSSTLQCDMTNINLASNGNMSNFLETSPSLPTALTPTTATATVPPIKKRESIQKRLARIFLGNMFGSSVAVDSLNQKKQNKKVEKNSVAPIPVPASAPAPASAHTHARSMSGTINHTSSSEDFKSTHYVGNSMGRPKFPVRYAPRIEPTPRITRVSEHKSQLPPFAPTSAPIRSTPTITTAGLNTGSHKKQGISPTTNTPPRSKDDSSLYERHHSLYGPQKGNSKPSKHARYKSHQVIRSSAGNGMTDESLEKAKHKKSKAIALFQKRSKSEELETNQLTEKQLRSSSYSTNQRIVETSVIYSKDESQDTVLSPTGEPEYAQGRVNQYHILKDIGTGAFGRVVLVRSEETKMYYACKVISKSRLRKKFRWVYDGKPSPQSLSSKKNEDNEVMASIKREVAVLKKLSEHPNIVNLVEVLDDEKEDNLYIIFDLCEYGPVMEINIGEPTRPLSEELARKYFRDVVLGIEYLHYKRIIHKDIKPENLLRTAGNIVQIGDFGISHMFDEGDDEGLLITKNGSPLYSAPEACTAETKILNGKSLDIWSLGVTLYCFVHGCCPWEDTNIVELYRKITQDNYVVFDTLSDELRDLLSKMMDKNPNTRIQLSQIKVHPWVTENGRNPMLSTESNCVYVDVTEEEVAHAFSPAMMFVNKIMKKFKVRSKSAKIKNNQTPASARASVNKISTNTLSTSQPYHKHHSMSNSTALFSEPNLNQRTGELSSSEFSSNGSVQHLSAINSDFDSVMDCRTRARMLVFDIDYGDGSITWNNYMTVDLNSSPPTTRHHGHHHKSGRHKNSQTSTPGQGVSSSHGKLFSFHSRNKSS